MADSAPAAAAAPPAPDTSHCWDVRMDHAGGLVTYYDLDRKVIVRLKAVGPIHVMVGKDHVEKRGVTIPMRCCCCQQHKTVTLVQEREAGHGPMQDAFTLRDVTPPDGPCPNPNAAG